jgi:hypothetical protein
MSKDNQTDLIFRLVFSRLKLSKYTSLTRNTRHRDYKKIYDSGFSINTVCSRFGPTETIVMGIPTSSSIKLI